MVFNYIQSFNELGIKLTLEITEVKKFVNHNQNHPYALSGCLFTILSFPEAQETFLAVLN